MMNKVILNAYPDSIGTKLEDIVNLLKKEEFKDVFSGFYILPSLYHSDLDRGFSVIDYSLNKELAKSQDLKELQDLNIDLKLDFILNHTSVLAPQFQDILKNGEHSKYKDFYINWNKFWENNGTMGEDGYIIPYQQHLDKMFFRKPGLPILMVRYPDGKEVPYWNTFYQEVRYPIVNNQDLMKSLNIQYTTSINITNIVNQALSQGINPKDIDLKEYQYLKDEIVDYLEAKRQYLGQMDVNINSPLVWQHYNSTLQTLKNYGASIIRLDAFAYAPKKVGKPNFLNEPETWEVLDKVNDLAKKYDLVLLPEIHASYSEKKYEIIGEKGFLVYDFFLPGLLLYCIEKKDGTLLKKWAQEIIDKDLKTVNMLGCHDGIPLLDLKGLLSDQEIQDLINVLVNRGGYVKNLEGQKNMYYQVNSTYYSALGEDDKKLLFARAVQLFMPGIPQIWYLDLFAGKNDYEALKRGHKEINRTNLSLETIEEQLTKDIVLKQLELLRLRNTHPVFKNGSISSIDLVNHHLIITWSYQNQQLILDADFKNSNFILQEL